MCGLCSSSPGQRQKEILNVALLGAAGVGKTTVKRQLQIGRVVHSTETRRAARLSIWANLFDAATTLAHLSDEVGDLIETIQPIVLQLRLVLADCGAEGEDRDDSAERDEEEELISEEAWDTLETIFAMGEVQQALQDVVAGRSALERREGIMSASPDVVLYFVGRLATIRACDYLPSDEDMLRLRRSTEGGNLTQLTLTSPDRPEGIDLQLLDLGGQAHEQAEWIESIQCNFGDETATHCVLYLISLDDYDTPAADNPKKGGSPTKLEMQIRLLENVFSSTVFKQSFVAVMLNKTDLITEERYVVRRSLRRLHRPLLCWLQHNNL